MSTNVEKVAAWREEHPSERLTAALLEQIVGRSLRGADLRYADLRYADLRHADLCHADLRYADLCYANLYDADLRYANLYDADLRYAYLSGADLRDCDLHYAQVTEPRILTMRTPSGWVTLVPTLDSWELRVGCWPGTPDTLRTLIAGDDWPEAEGSERDRRRPILAALADLCDAHIAYYGTNPLGVTPC